MLALARETFLAVLGPLEELLVREKSPQVHLVNTCTTCTLSLCCPDQLQAALSACTLKSTTAKAEVCKTYAGINSSCPKCLHNACMLSSCNTSTALNRMSSRPLILQCCEWWCAIGGLSRGRKALCLVHCAVIGRHEADMRKSVDCPPLPATIADFRSSPSA